MAVLRKGQQPLMILKRTPRKSKLRQRIGRFGAALQRFPVLDASFFLGGLALALALRLALLDFKSLDYYASLKPWYNAIKGGGFAVFATAFSTYNPPYLYLLYLVARFLPDAQAVVAVKLPSLLSDFVCAALVGLIVASKPGRTRSMPYLAALAVLFAPSIVLNSAFWGQADSLFAAGVLACIVMLIRERPGWAMIAFGIALALKLQAIFLAPVLLALLMRRRIPWRTLLYIPLVLVLAILPAWLAGRPLGDLLQVYAYQASQFEFITMNAPTVYALVPQSKRVFNLLYGPAVVMGGAIAFLWFILLLRSRRPLRGPLLVRVALVAMLVVPLFLPKMHERYFYVADLLSIAAAFLEPALFLVPTLVIGVSTFAYMPFLFEQAVIPLPLLALVLAAVTAYLLKSTIRLLYWDPASQGERRSKQTSKARPRSENGGTNL